MPITDRRTPDKLARDPNHPEVAAVLGQMARHYEQAWLDDAIPALAGHTPREAAADPTRRPDLIRPGNVTGGIAAPSCACALAATLMRPSFRISSTAKARGRWRPGSGGRPAADV